MPCMQKVNRFFMVRTNVCFCEFKSPHAMISQLNLHTGIRIGVYFGTFQRNVGTESFWDFLAWKPATDLYDLTVSRTETSKTEHEIWPQRPRHLAATISVAAWWGGDQENMSYFPWSLTHHAVTVFSHWKSAVSVRSRRFFGDSFFFFFLKPVE